MSAIKHSPGPWTVDTIDNEGEYSLGGDESASGFKSHAVLDVNGRVLFDSLNSEVAEIHEEIDEDARYAWDGQSECNLRLAAAAPELLDIASETRIAAAAYLEDHPHVAPDDCYATGPKTGNDYHDLVRCPGCQADASFRALIAKIDAAIAKATGA